ncbi:glycosyltransferase 87 family protein [Streptomyces sp. TR06-5]|uniref:glycosyltransferase 87 family protein n=1 Tax=unclassified Streptomyces TaxID=2593676 RepID=UPI0039A248B8
MSFAVFWAAQRAADASLIDVLVYRAQGRAVLEGSDLYALRATDADLPATYPPFAALLFVPLALLDVPLVRSLATAGNLLLLLAVAGLSLRLTGVRRQSRPAATALVAAVAVWCEPVWTTVRYGQINLLLAALVLWDLARRPTDRWAGVGIGLAAGIKLTPALFAVYLALAGMARVRHGTIRVPGLAAVRGHRERDASRRPSPGPWPRSPRLRQAAVASATFLATAAAAALVLPGTSRTFWTEVLLHAERVGNAEDTANQSLHGVLARALHTGDPGPAAATASVTAAGLGLAVAVAALHAAPRLPRAQAWAAAACAVTALLVSPVSWSHHWVWCVPAGVLLVAEALRRQRRGWWWTTAAGAGVFCSYALWWVPHSPDRSDRLELHQDAAHMALSAVYPAAGIAFLCLTASVVRRAHRSPGLPLPGTRERRGAPPQALAKE